MAQPHFRDSGAAVANDVYPGTKHDGAAAAMKLQEARRKKTFHTVTDFSLSHVLRCDSKIGCKFISEFAVKFVG